MPEYKTFFILALGVGILLIGFVIYHFVYPNVQNFLNGSKTLNRDKCNELLQSLVTLKGINATSCSKYLLTVDSTIKASHTKQDRYFFYHNRDFRTINPNIVLKNGSVQSIQVLNEDFDTESKHNFNIDKFNVHSNNLDYFQSQRVLFKPNSVGTFQYYCAIHPEMHGNVTVIK